MTLFKDVAHEYVHIVSVRQLADRAIRIALAQRTVTCIILPNDVQEQAMVQPEHRHGFIFTGLGYSDPRVVPQEKDLRSAAGVLNEGKRVAILVGAGALRASEEVLEIAELLGAGVAKALLGKAVLPDDLPFVTGSIGPLGTRPSWGMMMQCDTLLMIGSRFPYSEFLPKEGRARGVQVDIDGRMLSMRYPMEVNLVGDSRETIRALIPFLNRKSDRRWREGIEKSVREWWKVLEALARVRANPINPRQVIWELSSRLPDNCIIACDTGSVTTWFARYIQIRRGMMASVSGNLATMGSGIPYAIAAKFAFPDRPVFALVGDGAMQMNGNNELITIAKYWKKWRNPQLVILVLNNHDLNLVTWEQRVFAGDAPFEASQEIPDFPYARYAESIGLAGIRVDSPDEVGPAWDRALSADRPVVVEAVTDPRVPPLPPHITFDQAKAFAMSMLKGDADAVGVIDQSFKELKETLFPGRTQ